MPSVPIEPDSRLTRPNAQRIEWAAYTIKRHYKNAVKMTARFVGANCQCGRVARVQTADRLISECFELSGFIDTPLYLAVPMASDRGGRAELPRTGRQWVELAYELFKDDTREEMCRLGIDPSSDGSIQGAALRPGSASWEVASRHPHPFGAPVRGVARPTRPRIYQEEVAAAPTRWIESTVASPSFTYTTVSMATPAEAPSATEPVSAQSWPGQALNDIFGAQYVPDIARRTSPPDENAVDED